MTELIAKSKEKQKAIKKKAEQMVNDREEALIVNIVKRMLELFPEIISVQTKITAISFGMGSWAFNGKAIGYYKEEESEGLQEFDLYTLKTYLIEGEKGYAVTFPINEAAKEIAQLAQYFVNYNGDGLNASTCIDEITKDGLIFYREINPKSPFGYPPKSQLLKSSLYARLKKAGIKIKVVTKSR